MPPSPPRGPVPPIIFVNGLHRSGTTVVAEAATEASDGVTVTAGMIAESNPYLRQLLDAAASGLAVDRGVDARRLSPDLPEEYGWLLRDVGRVPAPNVRPRTIPALVAIVERLAGPEGARAVGTQEPVGFRARADAPGPVSERIRPAAASVHARRHRQPPTGPSPLRHL